MTDQSDKPKLGTRPPLGLKRTVETGKVKQSFSHGRSNTVVVEVKKRRILGKPGEAPAPAPAPEPVAEAPKPIAPAPSAPKAPPQRKLSEAEQIAKRKEELERFQREAEEARMAALEESRRRDDRSKLAQTEDEKRRAEEKVRKTTLELAQSREELRAKNQQMEEDLRMARDIQEAMIPSTYPCFPRNSTPETSSFRFQHVYIPTGQVGGDFFGEVFAGQLQEQVPQRRFFQVRAAQPARQHRGNARAEIVMGKDERLQPRLQRLRSRPVRRHSKSSRTTRRRRRCGTSRS